MQTRPWLSNTCQTALQKSTALVFLPLGSSKHTFRTILFPGLFFLNFFLNIYIFSVCLSGCLLVCQQQVSPHGNSVPSVVGCSKWGTHHRSTLPPHSLPLPHSPTLPPHSLPPPPHPTPPIAEVPGGILLVALLASLLRSRTGVLKGKLGLP